jgi:hypothetical protein
VSKRARRGSMDTDISQLFLHDAEPKLNRAQRSYMSLNK